MSDSISMNPSDAFVNPNSPVSQLTLQLMHHNMPPSGEQDQFDGVSGVFNNIATGTVSNYSKVKRELLAEIPEKFRQGYSAENLANFSVSGFERYIDEITQDENQWRGLEEVRISILNRYNHLKLLKQES